MRRNGCLWMMAVGLMVVLGCCPMPMEAQDNPAQVLSAQGFRSANGACFPLSMTSDARKILLASTASNLVPNDTNGVADLFIADLISRSIERVTVNSAGEQANGATLEGQLSDLGAIVIVTEATNLAGQSGVLYRPANSADWIALSSSGRSAGISRDGRWVVWADTEAGQAVIKLYDTVQSQQSHLSVGEITGGEEPLEGTLRIRGVSSDGRYLLFVMSIAPDFVEAWWYDRDADGNGVYDDHPAEAVWIDAVEDAALSGNGQTVVYIAASMGSFRELTVYHVPTDRRTVISAPLSLGTRLAISGDARQVAFATGDDEAPELRVWDTQTGLIQLVSLDYQGHPRTLNLSGLPSEARNVLLSESGSAVVFTAAEGAEGGAWVPGDTNRVADVIVRDLAEAKTNSSTTGPGTLNNDAAGSVSLDRTGSRSVFASSASSLVPGDTNGVSDIFIRFEDGSLRRIMGLNGAEPNGPSYDPKMSSDGNWVVFRSYATNLTLEGGNGKSQIYLYHIPTNQLWLVSRNASTGALGNDDSYSPSVSQNGQLVAFVSVASNLVGDDANNAADVFLYRHSDRGLMRVVPRAPDGSLIEPNGGSAEAVISDDGAWIAFSSEASNLVLEDTNGKDDIFVYEVATGRVMRITNAGAELNGDSYQPSISGDGRFVAFTTDASNIDPRDTDSLPDIYIWDRASQGLILASVNSFGFKADLGGRRPSISLDGQRVAFESDATNLMPMDRVADTDIFVYDSRTGWLYAVSVRGCVPGDAPSFYPVLSGNGQMVAFQTNASNLSDLPIGVNAYVALQRVVCTPPADINRDGVVDDGDLLQVLHEFGLEGDRCADISMDGIVDDTDLLLVLMYFGQECANASFVYGDDGSRSRRWPDLVLVEIFGRSAPTGSGFADAEGYHYSITSMTPSYLKSLERQAAELDMMFQGRWPYPVAGLGSDPWIALYGDPLTMSEEELQALLARFHNPAEQAEGDFSPASGSYSYSQSKEVRLGGSDVNVSASGWVYLYANCSMFRAEGRGEANVKFFPLNYKVAEAYGFAEARNTQATLHGYLRVAGNTLWSHGPETRGLTFSRSANIGPWNYRWSFRQTFWLGPVPVGVEAGFNLQVGMNYYLYGQLAPVRGEARFRPWVRSSAFAQGGVAFSIGCSASAGVSINLTLLNADLEAGMTGWISQQGNACYANINGWIWHWINALSGRFSLYAEACCWGLSGPGCGWWRKRQRWDWTLFNWGGYSNSGNLWQRSWTYRLK
jgi:Tol biopolymer transport system component